MRLLAAALLLLLSACAAAAPAKVQPVTTTASSCPMSPEQFKGVFGTKLPEMETLVEDKAQSFRGLVNTAGALKLDRSDLVLVAHNDKMFLAGFFLEGCVIGHIAGPWDAIKKFFGQKV